MTLGAAARLSDFTRMGATGLLGAAVLLSLRAGVPAPLALVLPAASGAFKVEERLSAGPFSLPVAMIGLVEPIALPGAAASLMGLAGLLETCLLYTSRCV